MIRSGAARTAAKTRRGEPGFKLIGGKDVLTSNPVRPRHNQEPRVVGHVRENAASW